MEGKLSYRGRGGGKGKGEFPLFNVHPNILR